MATKFINHIENRSLKANKLDNGTFKLDKWALLNRFLIIGTEGGSYSTNEMRLTKDNAKNLLNCVKEDGKRVVDKILEISKAGRAVSNNPALFALAVASAAEDLHTRSKAFDALPYVARIPTHLFFFVECREKFAGWGRSMKRAVRNWYQDKPIDKLAYYAIKYKQRNGWSNRDILRLTKPKPNSEQRDSIYSFMTTGYAKENKPKIIIGHDKVRLATNDVEASKLIKEYNLPREAIPTQFLNSIKVWEAMLPTMPMTALIRNLGKMSSIGLFNNTHALDIVLAKLTSHTYIKNARIHPMQVLVALKTYLRGKGLKGSLNWKVENKITKALNNTYYLSFDNADAANKRWIIGIDVSGSMAFNYVMNKLMSCSEVAAALAMTLVRTEKEVLTFGFDSGFQQVNLTAEDTLHEAMHKVELFNWGGTDCSLPMVWAASNEVKNDVFVVITDNETNRGVSPVKALNDYRQKMGIDAKLVVLAMTSNDISIADPKDSGMLDIAGMDTSVPKVITNFARGYELLTVPRIG